MHELIDEIKCIVEAACAAPTNVFGYGIWTHHILQVAENAKELAPEFGADVEIVEIAALLHDYASVKDESLYAEHHIHGPVEAEKILIELGYPSDRVERVKEAIFAHRGSRNIERRSAEAECLANADALAHLENVPSLLYLAYVVQGQSIDEGASRVGAKIRRSWHKLNPRIKERAEAQYAAAQQLLNV